jgi:signal transduction histidine kinase
MKYLLNNLLSLARLDSGLLETSRFERVQINDCVDEAVNAARILGESKGVRLHLHTKDMIEISGSRERLAEACLNVIENGVRYNSEGGSVEIETSREGNTAIIQVKDTGPGIEEKDLDRIFERFYRADTSRSSEGTGLGLSIAKAIVEAHGGEISAASTPGKGSCFLIRLPLSQNI